MAFWKSMKALLTHNYRDLYEATLATVREVFTTNMRRFPDADPNAWLALTLRSRMEKEFRGQPDWWYFCFTSDFSLVEPIMAASEALAIFILFESMPEIRAELPLLSVRFGEIMAPVFKLRESEEWKVRWRAVNPWSACRYPETLSGV